MSFAKVQGHQADATKHRHGWHLSLQGLPWILSKEKEKQKKCLQNFDWVPSHTSQVLFLYHCKVYLKFCPKKIVLFVNTWFPALRSPALFPRRWQRRTCWSSPQSPRAASHSNACPDPRLGKENYFWGDWNCCKNGAGERHVQIFRGVPPSQCETHLGQFWSFCGQDDRAYQPQQLLLWGHHSQGG